MTRQIFSRARNNSEQKKILIDGVEMDSFTYMIALVIMMLAIQFRQNWLVLGIVTVLALTTRNIKVTVLLAISAGVLYFMADAMKELWPFVLFGLVILSILFGIGKKEEQSPYGMDMGMGMPPEMGGMY